MTALHVWSDLSTLSVCLVLLVKLACTENVHVLWQPMATCQECAPDCTLHVQLDSSQDSCCVTGHQQLLFDCTSHTDPRYACISAIMSGLVRKSALGKAKLCED